MTTKSTDYTARHFLLSPGLFALLVCCLIVALVYLSHGLDPLAFALIGDKFLLNDPSGSGGYDGQFAYYIAVDPAGASPHLDEPPYRYQRILYPMLARLLALGQRELVPWTLLLINIFSISMSTELLGRMFSHRGLGPYLALLLPLWLGEIFVLRADLNEALCFLLVLIALWWYEDQRYLLSAVALSAGALTKEAALLFLPAAVVVLLLQRRWWYALRYAIIVLLPYLALQIGLSLWLGSSGLVGGGSRFRLMPFYGLATKEPLAAQVFLVLFLGIPITALLLLSVRQLQRTPQSVYAWALLVNCVYFVFLKRMTTIGIFRLTTGVVLAALLFCAAHRRRRLALVLHAVWLPLSMSAVMIPRFLW